jgi:hypothetical protein
MELDPSYLTSQTDRAEVERRINFANAPAEFVSDWNRLLEKMQPGDELWNFAPPSRSLEYWQHWGVALVRGGNVVSTLVEAIN